MTSLAEARRGPNSSNQRPRRSFSSNRFLSAVSSGKVRSKRMALPGTHQADSTIQTVAPGPSFPSHVLKSCAYDSIRPHVLSVGVAENSFQWQWYMFDMATSAYLSQGGPPNSDQEDGVMNLVNPAVSQGYSIPREQVVCCGFIPCHQPVETGHYECCLSICLSRPEHHITMW